MEMFNRLKSTLTNVLPGNPLGTDFEVKSHRASGGPGLLWKIYDGIKKTTKEVMVTQLLILIFQNKLNF